MPNWKNYEQRAREWYMRHRKKIYAATASSFLFMLIASILSFTTELISTELFVVMFLGAFLFAMALLFLVMFGEERYFQFPPPTRAHSGDIIRIFSHIPFFFRQKLAQRAKNI